MTNTVELPFGADKIEDYNPIVFLRVEEKPPTLAGTYISIWASEGRGYARGATLLVDGVALRTWRMDTVESLDGGDVVLARPPAGPISVTSAGRVLSGGNTVGWVKVASFGSSTVDGGAVLARSGNVTTRGSGGAEEFVNGSLDGGAMIGERFRSLFRLHDTDPLDGCRTEATDVRVSFLCDRGNHPSAVATIEGDALVLDVTTGGATPAVTRTLERLPLPPGACVRFTAPYRQYSPRDDRLPGDPYEGRKNRFDPFEGIALDRFESPEIQFPERCKDVGPGPRLDVHLLVPRHNRGDGPIIFIPAIGLRKDLGMGRGDGECEARVYPRSGIAIVRCYPYDGTTIQRSVFVEQSELLAERRGVRLHPGAPPTKVTSTLLPCNSNVRYLIQYK